ncbi:grass carp reovirus (GCRV)-induced gene 2o [Carcharodon carcharias]|uniref:grass carp reovirus (GCRV)-induced gene 2o n=1 Tax=Carcharodon carcharias TaxID=13397 RepID=UPI001B7F37C7|nr:grass carp reovirus (GCRV)-induced gene 2o [Carcharodon carcharias]
MSVEFYGWQAIYEDKGHLKAGQELQDGRGYTMYHGTHKNNAANIIRLGFIPSKDGLLGPGIYVSRDMNKARAYPKLIADHDKVVFKLKVRVGKVKKIDLDNHPLQKTWHQQGYDCAWVPPKCGMSFIPSGKEEDCIWDPKRITVVDVAYANDLVKKDLRKLICKQPMAKKVKLKDQCDVCGYQKYSSHVIQKCWGCEKDICPFLSKHVCKEGTKTSGEMALTFFGWDTIYDNNHHLQSSQEPMNGTEYIMYHGTSVNNARSIIQSGFKQSGKGMLGPGVYVSRDKEKARRYPINRPNDRVILMLKVRVGKVKKIDRENHPMATTWNQQGYDTAWVPPNCGMRNVPSGLEEDCVWDPQRIRVIDIINSPDPVTTQQLKDLLQASLNSQPVSGLESGEHCEVCRNTLAPSHQLQSCWGCGQTICPFMERHFCAGSRNWRMDIMMECDIELQPHSFRALSRNLSLKLEQLMSYKKDHLIKTVPDMDNKELKLKLRKLSYKVQMYAYSAAELLTALREVCLFTMAYACGNTWAEEDGPDFVPACLQSYTAPQNNKIYKMYHGTTEKKARLICRNGFHQSKHGMLGPGVYVSRDIEKASRYPMNLPYNEQKVVLELKVKVGRVKKIDYQGHPLQYTWHYEGYDTAWCPPNCGMVPSGLEEDCVWDPNRITVTKVLKTSSTPDPRAYTDWC